MNYLELIREKPALFNNIDTAFEIITDPDQILAWQKIERKSLLESNNPISFADIGIILDNPYFIVIRDLVRFSDKHLGGYLRIIYRCDLEFSESVAILPKIKEKFVINRQYRHATRKWHFEIPRGWGEANELKEIAAIRELKEEIGGVVKELIDLGSFYPNTGLEGSKVSLFFALLKSIGNPEENEGISNNILLSRRELEEMICKGDISDSFTIASYSRALLRGLL